MCFFFQAEDGIRGQCVTGVQTCALPIQNGKENGLRKKWDEDGKLVYEGNYIDGVEEIK